MPYLVTALKMPVKGMDPEFSLFCALMKYVHVCTCSPNSHVNIERQIVNVGNQGEGQ